MADTKVSALTELAVEPATTDEFYINDGGTSKKIQYTTLESAIASEANVLAALSGATTTEVTPAASDKILMLDADDTDNIKHCTFSDFATAAQGALADSALQDVVDDTTPQLGGSLDVNGQKIVSVSNGNIDIEPNGTGNVLLGNLTFDADQTVGAGQDNYVLTYDHSGGVIALEAASGGGAFSADGNGLISASSAPVLDEATGNEVAYTFAYQTNKATSGSDTGVLISMTDTASPGTSLPLDIKVGGTSIFYVENDGDCFSSSGIFGLNSTNYVNVDTGTIYLRVGAPSHIFSTTKYDMPQGTYIEIDRTTEDAGFIDFRATADADATSAISTLTTSGATSGHIQIMVNGSPAWIAYSTTDPS